MMAAAQPSKSAMALKHVLQNHKANEIETSGTVIEIDSTKTPMEAAKILWENNILGAPVWDAKKKKYLGFFDMRDILTLVLASHKKHKKEGKTPTGTDVMASWFDDQQNLSIGHISYYAARNPFVSCRGDTPLEEVGRILTERHCHRVPIANDEGRCVGIISQSALVKFLVAHCDTAPDNSSLDGETLGEANLLYRKDIVAAMDTTSALEAFEMLDNHRLSGIAVVDEEDGRLVGNTSARDIKLLVQGKLTETASLEMDILSYLAAARQAVPTKKERYPSAHVAENSTVGHAIRLLSKTGYHRVFVVDGDCKPVGVVSVADIVRFAVE